MLYVRSIFVVLFLGFCASALAQTTTAFHYAGTLTDSQMAAATGNYDIRVRLYDGPNVGANQLGSDVLVSPVAVVLGFFAIDIDFGAAILAPQSWLEFAVQPTGGAGFQTLSPRQQIGHVPFALYAEGADWSGITNVPPAVTALTNPVPPAIGSIATSPSLAGAGPSPNQLAVRQVQFTATRPVSQTPPNTSGVVAVQDVELWLEPTLALPSIITAIGTGTAYNLTLNLNFVSTASNTIAKFTGVQFDSATLEPATDASGTTLAHVKFRYVTVQLLAPSLTYTYNVATRVSSGLSATCTGFLSTLGYGAVPADFPATGLVTLSQPNIFNETSSGSTPQFGLPEMSVALTSATASASASLVNCAFQMLTFLPIQKVTPAPTWSQFPVGAADSTYWSTQLAWTGVFVSGFGLNSDSSGNVSLSWEFTPITTYEVRTQDAAKTKSYSACWNISTNVSC